MSEMDEIKEVVKRKVDEILKFKERYVEAWIAETGVLPSECELIQQQGFQEGEFWGQRIYLRRKTGDNLVEKSQYNQIKALESRIQKLEAVVKESRFLIAFQRYTETGLTPKFYALSKALQALDELERE